ncbi:MAG: response regulator [Nitrospirae bacterium]|nr:MAG: response regulator [Nitrospirota bacterium]
MIRVLVVEDSDSTRAMIRTIVEDLGEEFLVFDARNGFEALRMLPSERFDLILTDINMPDINGLELINFVKNNADYRDIPLIIVSTERTEEDRKRGMELGADAYITKPFKPEELQETVKRVLER